MNPDKAFREIESENVVFGRGGFGNIRYGMKRIWTSMLIIFITIR